jgi:hypothetical protein
VGGYRVLANRFLESSILEKSESKSSADARALLRPELFGMTGVPATSVVVLPGLRSDRYPVG